MFNGFQSLLSKLSIFSKQHISLHNQILNRSEESNCVKTKIDLFENLSIVAFEVSIFHTFFTTTLRIRES